MGRVDGLKHTESSSWITPHSKGMLRRRSLAVPAQGAPSLSKMVWACPLKATAQLRPRSSSQLETPVHRCDSSSRRTSVASWRMASVSSAKASLVGASTVAPVAKRLGSSSRSPQNESAATRPSKPDSAATLRKSATIRTPSALAGCCCCCCCCPSVAVGEGMAVGVGGGGCGDS